MSLAPQYPRNFQKIGAIGFNKPPQVAFALQRSCEPSLGFGSQQFVVVGGPAETSSGRISEIPTWIGMVLPYVDQNSVVGFSMARIVSHGQFFDPHQGRVLGLTVLLLSSTGISPPRKAIARSMQRPARRTEA